MVDSTVLRRRGVGRPYLAPPPPRAVAVAVAVRGIAGPVRLLRAVRLPPGLVVQW